MPQLHFIDIFAIAFFSVILITPGLRRLALKKKWVDQPDHRKIHREPIPRIGGLALYLGFLLAFLTAVYGLEIFQKKEWVAPILLGSTGMLVLGFWDDLQPLSAWKKLFLQILIATGVWWLGIRIEFINHPFSDGYLYLQAWSLPLTVFWMVLFMNTINLIDGLDGLASGLTSIAATTLLTIALATSQNDAAVLAVILLGICLGFLRHNFFPASIFMGDSGSLLLGFLLSVISMIGVLKSTTASMAIAIPLLALAIPLMDTLWAILRRMKNRQPLFRPDQNHLHHRLLGKGYSQKQVAILLYYLAIFMAAFALMFSFLKGLSSLLGLSILVFIFYLGFRILQRLT